MPKRLRKTIFMYHCVQTKKRAKVGTRIACLTSPEAASAAGEGGGGVEAILFTPSHSKQNERQIAGQNGFQRPSMHQVAPRFIIKDATEKSGVHKQRTTQE